MSALTGKVTFTRFRQVLLDGVKVGQITDLGSHRPLRWQLRWNSKAGRPMPTTVHAYLHDARNAAQWEFSPSNPGAAA
ncbi:hypothetical protein [Roseomonas haemaphysalidis]|uniref:Uncharacterized protein n=1 Tax=Roseomonas haemaphysalidis TaxID=2768162 RepID=A0ABS3KTT0_9PROT|nr:hypothetical protein [Roseomonas haemaphysalidis]MBO1080873.1 hypothetical protein [Roseomonas haemaphysalidis]